MPPSYRQVPARHNNHVTSQPPRQYIPDPMGRIGRGHWTSNPIANGTSLATRLDRFQRRGSPHGTIGHSSFGDTVGRNKSNRPRDISELESMLDQSGHYDASLTDGPTGYFSQRLDGAIRKYQTENNLATDGIVTPGGPTISSLTGIATKHTPTNSARTDNNVAMAVAVFPAIAYKIANYLGITVMAAWTWWQSLSVEQKKGILQKIEDAGTAKSNEERCDELLYEIDGPTCTAVGRKRGKRAERLCRESAQARYAACLRGVPIEELPPLNVWNN